MQSDRYINARTAQSCCAWCFSDFQVAASRASDSVLFCTRKCEIQARFWLLDQMNAAIELRRRESPLL